MKRNRLVLGILTILPTVVTLVVFQFLPEVVPLHYGINNQVDRWGSKYEFLILPLLVLLTGILLLIFSKRAGKQQAIRDANERTSVVTGIFILLILNVVVGYFLYATLKRVKNLNSIPLELNQLIVGSFGIMMICVGNIMPKLKINSLIGVRTAWSMKNEVTWKKSQRFGGIIFIVTGFLLLLLVAFYRGFIILILFITIILIQTLIIICYTYNVAKKTEDI